MDMIFHANFHTNLHEMSNPVFQGKKTKKNKKTSSVCCLLNVQYVSNDQCYEKSNIVIK